MVVDVTAVGRLVILPGTALHLARIPAHLEVAEEVAAATMVSRTIEQLCAISVVVRTTMRGIARRRP